MLLFIVKTPKRHLLGRKHAVWALTRRRTTCGATWTLSDEYKKIIKKGSPECTAKIKVVAQTPPVNRSLPNFACGFVSRICFLVLSFRKIGWKMWELWGSKFRPSHWKGTSLIQQLVATAQAVINACPSPSSDSMRPAYSRHISNFWVRAVTVPDIFHFFLNIYRPRELRTLGAKNK